MTQIEMDMARAIVAMNKKMHSINWEKRRYEVAKEIYPTLLKSYASSLGTDIMSVVPISATHAVKCANALIEELKKQEKNHEKLSS